MGDAHGRLSHDTDPATLRFEKAQHQFEQGGLAAAVGAEQPEHVAARNGESASIEGNDFAESLVQVLEREHEG